MIGVLLMAYGTPERAEDVEAYYTDIRRGRPPSPAQLADLVRRYDAIGGISPLAQRTRAQQAGLQAALGDGFVVELGLKHASPFVEDGAGALADRPVERVVGIVLAPHFSAGSVGEYHDRAAASLSIPYVRVDSWHLEPGLIELLGGRWAAVVASFTDAEREDVETIVTAHSLPSRVIEAGDPYADQLRETAEALATRCGIRQDRWRIAWQSAGHTPEPWLGPDILEVIPSLAAQGRRGIVIVAAGFTADHLEVLYDIDVEAKAAAAEHGLRLVRTESLNDDPAAMAVLADVVRRAVA